MVRRIVLVAAALLATTGCSGQPKASPTSRPAATSSMRISAAGSLVSVNGCEYTITKVSLSVNGGVYGIVPDDLADGQAVLEVEIGSTDFTLCQGYLAGNNQLVDATGHVVGKFWRTGTSSSETNSFLYVVPSSPEPLFWFVDNGRFVSLSPALTTDTATPKPIANDSEIQAACRTGSGIPEADVWNGKVDHNTVTASKDDAVWKIGAYSRQGSFQILVCEQIQPAVHIGYCNYSGAAGRFTFDLQWRNVQVDVRVARTGKKLGSKLLKQDKNVFCPSNMPAPGAGAANHLIVQSPNLNYNPELWAWIDSLGK